jgi:hypothetical protein
LVRADPEGSDSKVPDFESAVGIRRRSPRVGARRGEHQNVRMRDGPSINTGDAAANNAGPARRRVPRRRSTQLERERGERQAVSLSGRNNEVEPRSICGLKAQLLRFGWRRHSRVYLCCSVADTPELPFG